MQGHVPIVAWLLIVTNRLAAALGLLVMAATLGAPTSMLAKAFAYPVLMVVLSLPGLVAGFGLRERQPWSRWFGIIGVVVNMAALAYGYYLRNMHLSVVVIGAIIGIYAIVVLAMRPVAVPRHA